MIMYKWLGLTESLEKFCGLYQFDYEYELNKEYHTNPSNIPNERGYYMLNSLEEAIKYLETERQLHAEIEDSIYDWGAALLKVETSDALLTPESEWDNDIPEYASSNMRLLEVVKVCKPHDTDCILYKLYNN